MKKSLLLVDDDSVIRNSVKLFLEAKDFTVFTAADGAEAQVVFRSRRPDAVIVDYALPDSNALDLLERFQSVDADCPVIVLTGHASIDLAVRAIQQGASHFLTKPIELPALLAVIQRMLESQSLKRQETARKSTSRTRLDPFAGTSAAIRALHAQVRKVASADSPILIYGETGTGKGVLSRWIHANSHRSDGPFVDLNAAGLTREFLDSELFGHEKGAFTGAVAAKQGLFEVAHGGTLFLDEIGDVDPQLQPKLLKVVEEKRFRRLGEVQDRVVDVRLIGATHRDLAAMSRDGSFRSDLFFRISTFPITIPPLRSRAEDIPLLAETILDDLARAMGKPRPRIDAAAMRVLQEYGWPGNVRELRNVLERALLLVESDTIRTSDLVLQFAGAAAQHEGDDSQLTLEEMERKHIARILALENGRVDSAAKRLGVPRSSLYQKLKRFGIGTPKS